MRILPDGTVEIRNKSSGETKIVKPQDLPSYGIPYSKYAGELEAFQKITDEGKEEEGVGKIAAKDKALASTGIRTTKQAAKLFEKDPSVLTKQLMPGKFASREWDTVMYDAADALLRLRTGAQANPSEIRGYMKTIAPSFGDSQEVVQVKLNKMMANFAAYTGEQPETVAFKEQEKPSRAGSLIGGLLGGAGGFMVGGPVGAGLGGAAGAAGGGAAQEMIEDLLGVQTEKGLAPVAGVAKEAVKRGGQAYGLASLLNLTKLGKGLRQPGVSLPSTDLGQKVVDVSEKARSLSPKSILGNKQIQAAIKQEGKPNINKIISVGKKLANTDPDVEKLLPKQLPKIENIKDFKTLVERMQVWGRTAFKASGGIKGTAKAELYKGFYKEGLAILKTQAPEVYKYRRLLGLAYEIPKAASKTLWRATLGKILTGGGI